MPLALFDTRPRVALLRLAGTIAARPGPGSLNIESVGPVIDRAFAQQRLGAVVLVINSPGGSAVQSNLIANRIRRLADRKRVPVIACVEDAAASGGYWLACAADEIVADPASIVGSIGVIAQSFGAASALARLGIERRLRTAGEQKSVWDPFRPERPEDTARIDTLLAALHEEFRAWVRARRGDRLRADEATLFSGAFWAGRQAVELGLADRLGDAESEIRARFGDRVRIVSFGARRQSLLRRLLPGLTVEAALDAVEDRAAWARVGL